MDSIPIQLPLFLPDGKVCVKCGICKPLADFSIKHAKSGRRDTRCKACMNAYCAARYAAHPERQHAASARWRAANQERIKAVDAEWRRRNRDRTNVRVRVWYQANKERKSRTNAEWICANKVRQARNVKAWKGANPGRAHAIRARRRRFLAGAITFYTAAEWEALKARYDYRCLMCGRQEPEIALTFDHVIPLSQGGSNDIGNGQPLCQPCNSRKGTKRTDLR